MKKITVAIDGHSSCGKSTMARWLASKVGYIYVDTGAMYRAVALFALRNNLFNDDGSVDSARLEKMMPAVDVGFRLDPVLQAPLTFLDGENVEREIRGMTVSSHVSTVATLPFVRTAMTALQQQMGQDKGVVMDGRDIGTVVFPHAELKVFVTASAEVRARRRCDELAQKGQRASYDEILKNVMNRDFIDSHRQTAPLKRADDALLLDNSRLSVEEQNAWLLARFNERTENKS